MHASKVVDFLPRIPEKFSLHFFDFSTILYVIYKFTARNPRIKFIFSFESLELLFRPLKLYVSLQIGPSPDFGEQRKGPARFRRDGLAGGEARGLGSKSRLRRTSGYWWRGWRWPIGWSSA